MSPAGPAPAEHPGSARPRVVVTAVLLAALSVLGWGSLAVQSPAAAAATSPSPSVSAASTSAPSASAPSVSTPSPSPGTTGTSTSITETTTTRRPLPGWAIAVVAVLAVGGAVAAYPATRGR